MGLAIGPAFAKLFNRQSKIQNPKSRLAPVPAPQLNPPIRPGGGPPPVPLAVWAVGVLAYPAWLLVTQFATGGANLLNAAALALPDLLLEGILRLRFALLSAALWAIAIGSGSFLLRKAGFGFLTRSERAIFGGALGMGILSIGTFLLGSLAGSIPRLSRSFALPLLALLLALAAAGLRDFIGLARDGGRALADWRPQARWLSLFTILFGALIILFALTRANVPVVADYDALEYHLAAPAQWWRAGQVTFLRDNIYTNFPQNTEMLYLLAMACFGGPMVGAIIGQQVGVGFVLLAAAGIAACGRRLHSAAAGRAGGAMFLATPMLPGLATLNSYIVELPMAAYSFLALFAFLLLRKAHAGEEWDCHRDTEGAERRWPHTETTEGTERSTDRRNGWRCAILCGTMIGLAIGCKYLALAFVLFPILAFILAQGFIRLAQFPRALAETALVGAVALAATSPWLIRNAINTRNPVYPLLYRAFDGRHWSPQQDAKFEKAHRTEDGNLFDLMPAFAARFWRFALWRDQPGGGMGNPPAAALLLLFGLIPIAMGDRRSTRVLLCFAVAFLGAAAIRRFGHPGLYTEATLMIFAVGVLGLVTCPAFLLTQGDAIFLALHVTLWLIVWNALTQAIDRFLDPATAAAAVLAGIGLASIQGRRLRRVAEWLVPASLAYAGLAAFLMHLGPLWLGLTEPPEKFCAAAFEGSTYCEPAIAAINRDLPPDAIVLFVGESRTFYCQRRVIAPTVFDRSPIERILDWEGEAPAEPGPPERRVRDGLRALGITHLYVNGQEIHRLSQSYGYRFDGQTHDGFSDTIAPGLFARMAEAGYLRVVGSFSSRPDTPPAFVVYELQ